MPENLKNVEHVDDADASWKRRTWNDPKRIEKKIETVGNQRRNRDYSDYSIVDISQNNEKIPGDLLSLRLQ